MMGARRLTRDVAGALALALATLLPLGAKAEAPDVPAAEGDAEVRRLRAHFDEVLTTLRSRDVAHLDAATRGRRAAALDAVEAYAASGVFPRNPGVPHPQEVFIDPEGRRCAMAELLFVTGAEDEAWAIAARENLARIEDMTSPELDPWLAHHGFTREEAQAIQPGYCFGACPRTPEPVCTRPHQSIDAGANGPDLGPATLFHSACVADCFLGEGRWTSVSSVECEQQTPSEGFGCIECAPDETRCSGGAFGPSAATTTGVLALGLLVVARRRARPAP